MDYKTLGFSKYPNEVDDSTTLPPATDLITPVKAEAVNRLRDALLAIETELGAQPSDVFGTVKARLNALNAEIETIKSTSGEAKVSSLDTTFDFLENKIVAGTNIMVTKLGSGANESLQISTTGGGGGGGYISQIDLSVGFYETDIAVPSGSVIGARPFDPSLFTDIDSITFRAVLAATTGMTARIELYNLDDVAIVKYLTTTSTVPVVLETTLDIPADIPNANRLYSARLFISAGTPGPTDRAFCYYSGIEVILI